MDENLNFNVKVSVAEIYQLLNIPIVFEKKKDEEVEEEEL